MTPRPIRPAAAPVPGPAARRAPASARGHDASRRPTLAGRVAIVTGATGGIGRAVANRLAAEGVSLVLSGRREARGLPPGARYLAGDLRTEAHAEALAGLALSEFGRIDILVNAHGVDHHADIAATDIGAAREVLDVNLLGCLATMKHAIPALRRGGGGAIVNVASRLGIVAIPGQAVYSASKGGLIMLSRGAAIDLAPDGVRVNVVAPGITDTEMISAWVRSQPDPAAFRRDLERSIPLGRLATPEEIAAAVLYLASDESTHVTGAVLTVDGGYTAI